MRKSAGLLLVAGFIAFAAGTGWAQAHDLEEENAKLRSELELLRARLSETNRRLDALESRLPASAPFDTNGHRGSASARAELDVQDVAANGATGEESPGVVSTFRTAFERLLTGTVTAPTVLPPGYGVAPQPAEPSGVIVQRPPGPPKLFLPDIGLVGDFLFQQSNFRRGDPRFDPGADKFNVREVELIFASPIDPYTFAQIELAFEDGGVEIEQAYLLFDRLPLLQLLPINLGLKVGQFRPRFGLINELENFQLPMVNRPNALANFVGDEGFIEPGINLSTHLPNPWDADLRLDLNMLSGVNEASWNRGDGANFDFAYIASLIYSRELFQSGYLTTGISFAEGPGEGGAAFLQDAFLQIRYAPDPRSILTWSIEGLLAQRKGVGDAGTKRGLYSMVDYNFDLRYHLGFLVDWADTPNVARGSTVGISPILTYFVSDGTRLRLQYTYTTPSGPERRAHQVFLQATFSFGNLKHLD